MESKLTPLFSPAWSMQTPFSVDYSIQHLKAWVAINPWFKQEDTSQWFDVPSDVKHKMQMEYQGAWAEIGLKLMLQQPFSFTDRRFKGEHWSQPLFGSVAAYYLLNSSFIMRLLDELPVKSEKAKKRLAYLVEQAVAATAPSNFLATNPEALHKAVETGGASLLSGMMHLMSDMQEGKMRQCDAGDFKIGETVAATEGNVVYENDLFQLIHYQPKTAKQFKRPMLIAPPAINKYYILDLTEKKSVVRHLLEQGHSVFLMSWRNFDMDTAHITWDDMVQDGIINAIGIVRALTKETTLNCVGFCIGGTLLSSALAVLAARGDTDFASLTLLTTFLDYVDTGPIDVFVDEEMVQYRERTIGGQQGGYPGLFRGEDMGNTFSLLRPNELWWNYNVDKYLKGEKPRTLDLLFWNNDSTNLPGPMYCWYLRHTYLQNDLKSGTLSCCGETLDLAAIKTPAFILGTKEDHIVPWRSAYASRQVLGGETHFILGASGHIAGVINPPADNKRSYWVNEAPVESPEQWFEGATEHPGSWWTEWYAWLAKHSGTQVAARKAVGSSTYPVIEPAPGRYVKG